MQSFTMEEQKQFCTTNGIKLGSVSAENYLNLLNELLENYITPLQLCEAASFCMAMVVRHALGLSASAGQVAVFFNDSLAGQVTVATARHLRNAGATVHMFTTGDPDHFDDNIKKLLRPFTLADIAINRVEADFNDKDLTALLPACHNVILGLHNERGDGVSMGYKKLVDLFNEHPIPVHTVLAPLGVDLDSGQKNGPALFASSTLSLGAPLQGLIAAQDYVGRHYVCDISIPLELYAKYKLDYRQAFCEQPVIQIFPEK